MNDEKTMKAFTTWIIQAVTGRGGPQVCETPRIPYFVHNGLTDGGEFVSLTLRQPALYPQDDSWYSFMLEAE
jgi:hypothetical protein